LAVYRINTNPFYATCIIPNPNNWTLVGLKNPSDEFLDPEVDSKIRQTDFECPLEGHADSMEPKHPKFHYFNCPLSGTIKP
jgi:hypothetical protein